MDTFNKIVLAIIEAQQTIIGPLAWDEAQNVSGLSVSTDHHVALISGGEDPKIVVDRLVNQYSELFGTTSKEVCREAVAGMLKELPEGDVPLSLKK
jgi:hypothetical protein